MATKKTAKKKVTKKKVAKKKVTKLTRDQRRSLAANPKD
jgi:hypothetical protein